MFSDSWLRSCNYIKMKYELHTTNLHPQPHGNSVDNKNSSKITSLFIAYQLSSYYRITKWNDWYVNDFLLRRMNTLYAVIIHLHISHIPTRFIDFSADS